MSEPERKGGAASRHLVAGGLSRRDRAHHPRRDQPPTGAADFGSVPSRHSLISLVLPLYAYLLGALIVGVILGGTAAWMAQGRWRRVARRRATEAVRWQAEADRLRRERHKPLAAAPTLVPARR